MKSPNAPSPQLTTCQVLVYVCLFVLHLCLSKADARLLTQVFLWCGLIYLNWCTPYARRGVAYRRTRNTGGHLPVSRRTSWQTHKSRSGRGMRFRCRYANAVLDFGCMNAKRYERLKFLMLTWRRLTGSLCLPPRELTSAVATIPVIRFSMRFHSPHFSFFKTANGKCAPVFKSSLI